MAIHSQHQFTKMPTWAIVLAVLGLIALVAFAVWAGLTTPPNPHWPPTTIDF